MNQTNIYGINEVQIFDNAEVGFIGEPPIGNLNLKNVINDYLDSQIHFYIKYDYFPIKSFGSLNKSVNELYELVFFILYKERVRGADTLVLEIAKTGNSIDLIIALLEKLKPSKKALIVITIVVALIIAIEIADNHNQKTVEIKHTIYKIIETEANTEKTKAETAKINAEREKIEFEKVLLKHKIQKDSIDAINTQENRRKINRKRRTIQNSVMQRPITQTVINGNVIYNNISTRNQ